MPSQLYHGKILRSAHKVYLWLSKQTAIIYPYGIT